MPGRQTRAPAAGPAKRRTEKPAKVYRMRRLLALCALLCVAAAAAAAVLLLRGAEAPAADADADGGSSSSTGQPPAAQNAADMPHVYSSTGANVLPDDPNDNITCAAMLGQRVCFGGMRYGERAAPLVGSANTDGSSPQFQLLAHTPVSDDALLELRSLIAGTDCLYALLQETLFDSSPTVYNYYIDTLSPDGTLQSSLPLQLPEGAYPSGLALAPDGRRYLYGDFGFALVAADGSCTVLAVNDQRYVYAMAFFGPSQAVVQAGGVGIGVLDVAAQTLTPLPGGQDLPYDTTVVAGPDGSICLKNNKGIYSYREEDGMQMVCSWMDSDLDGYSVAEWLFPQQDGSFVAVGYAPQNWQAKRITVLTWADPSAMAAKQVLTVAYLTPPPFIEQDIRDFNRSSDSVRLVIKDYSEYGNWLEAITPLNLDIISGDVPDILLVTNNMPFDTYLAKGLFTDLYPLLDADESYSRADLLPNLLQLCETGGKLTSIIPQFGLFTAAGPTALVGQPGWNWAEFAALPGQYPYPISGYDRSGLLYMGFALDGGSYVDDVTGSCNFDCDGFRALLECAKACPEGGGSIDNDKNDLATGQSVAYAVNLYSFDDLRNDIYKTGGDFCYKGFPTSDGHVGSGIVPVQWLAISENCANKAAAWQFVRFFLSEAYFSRESFTGFPLRADLLQQQVAKAQQPRVLDLPAAGDWLGDAPAASLLGAADGGGTGATLLGAGISASHLSSGGEIDNDPCWTRALTPQETDKLVAAVTGAAQLFRADPDIYNIIAEEAASYFAGDKSLDEVIKLIQNRVSICLAERR